LSEGGGENKESKLVSAIDLIQQDNAFFEATSLFEQPMVLAGKITKRLKKP